VDARKLIRRRHLGSNGFTIKRLPNGDAIVTIRHDQARRVVVTGNDPQRELRASERGYSGTMDRGSAVSPALAMVGAEGEVTARIFGNQLRLTGTVGPDGGLADIYLDGEKQLVHLDCWNPAERQQQVLYYRNGLTQGPHTLRVIPRRSGNPYSKGARIDIQSVQFSAATGPWHFPMGTGPRESQRFVLGYPERKDYQDSARHSWRPGTEFVSRATNLVDTVAAFWWTNPAPSQIRGTTDSELYRYGIHGHDFWINTTVGPGHYHVRLKLAATRGLDTTTNAFDIRINGEYVVKSLDVSATAKGINRAVDLVFNDIQPKHGIIEIRFTGATGLPGNPTTLGEAFVQAVEIGPGRGGRGSLPVFVTPGKLN